MPDEQSDLLRTFAAKVDPLMPDLLAYGKLWQAYDRLLTAAAFCTEEPARHHQPRGRETPIRQEP